MGALRTDSARHGAVHVFQYALAAQGSLFHTTQGSIAYIARLAHPPQLLVALNATEDEHD